MAVGKGNLPNPDTTFIMGQRLPAQDLNELVDNIEALAMGTGIGDKAVSTSALADSAVTAGKIASSAVTSSKIDSNAVTSSKIGSNAVTNAKIAANAVKASNIDFSSLDRAKSNNWTIQRFGNTSQATIRGTYYKSSPSEITFYTTVNLPAGCTQSNVIGAFGNVNNTTSNWAWALFPIMNNPSSGQITIFGRYIGPETSRSALTITYSLMVVLDKVP